MILKKIKLIDEEKSKSLSNISTQILDQINELEQHQIDILSGTMAKILKISEKSDSTILTEEFKSKLNESIIGSLDSIAKNVNMKSFIRNNIGKKFMSDIFANNIDQISSKIRSCSSSSLDLLINISQPLFSNLLQDEKTVLTAVKLLSIFLSELLEKKSVNPEPLANCARMLNSLSNINIELLKEFSFLKKYEVKLKRCSKNAKQIFSKLLTHL